MSRRHIHPRIHGRRKWAAAWALAITTGLMPQPSAAQLLPTDDAVEVAPASLHRVAFSLPSSTADDVTLPPAVDNSLSDFFPPVISQTGGSCAYASSIGHMLTYEWNRLMGTDAAASAQNRLSYLFVWNMLNDGHDEGGFTAEAMQVPMRYGIMSEAEYGKSGQFQFRWATGYDRYLAAMRRRVLTIYTMPDSIDLMRRYLYDKGQAGQAGGLLTFSAQSTGWTIDDDYQWLSLTGYRSLLTSLATGGSHAMTLVGYDDSVRYADTEGIVHRGAFIVVNSWGEDWQDRGRFYLPYDFFRDPSVSTLQLGNTVEGVEVGTYAPMLVARLALSYTSRNDLYFRTARTASATRLPLQERQYPAFYCWGGDHPMQGQFLSSDIELAIDLTDLAASADSAAPAYWLNIVRSHRGTTLGEGRVTALELIDYRDTPPRVYPYRGTLPATLQLGNNFFSISPLHPVFLPTSAHRYRNAQGTLYADSTFVVGLADGRRAKLQFTAADTLSHTLTITYQLP